MSQEFDAIYEGGVFRRNDNAVDTADRLLEAADFVAGMSNPHSSGQITPRKTDRIPKGISLFVEGAEQGKVHLSRERPWIDKTGIAGNGERKPMLLRADAFCAHALNLIYVFEALRRKCEDGKAKKVRLSLDKPCVDPFRSHRCGRRVALYFGYAKCLNGRSGKDVGHIQRWLQAYPRLDR